MRERPHEGNRNKIKKFVIGPSASHIPLWIEERRAETNGHDDPTQRSKSFIKFFLNEP